MSSHLFPEWLFSSVIYGALGFSSLTAVFLIAALIRDWKDKKLW